MSDDKGTFSFYTKLGDQVENKNPKSAIEYTKSAKVPNKGAFEACPKWTKKGFGRFSHLVKTKFVLLYTDEDSTIDHNIAPAFCATF